MNKMVGAAARLFRLWRLLLEEENVNSTIRMAIGLGILNLGLMGIGVSAAQAPPSKINYSVEKKSVQYVVIDLAAQVGLGYNWQKSAAQTDPERRRFLGNLTITNQPFEQAMKQVLAPVKLRYEVEDQKIVLYRQ